MALCKICGKHILLIPSATERAKKYGGTPAQYTKLFTTHSFCAIDKNKKEVEKLIRSLK